MSNQYEDYTDEQLEASRVAIRDEQTKRNSRRRVEEELKNKLAEYTEAGGDVQSIFETLNNAEPEPEAEELDGRENVENIFENNSEYDAPVKFDETAPPVLEDAETNE